MGSMLNYISLAMGVISLCGVLWGIGYRLGTIITEHRADRETLVKLNMEMQAQKSLLDKAQVKTDAMWDFQMRRFEAEGRQVGFMERRSPLQATAYAEKILSPVLDEAHRFYRQSSSTLDDKELFMALDQQFGNRLVDIVAPLGLPYGACVRSLCLILRRESQVLVQGALDGQASQPSQ